MKYAYLCCVTTVVILMMNLTGCISKAEFDKCVRRNQVQQERIESLEAAQEAKRLEVEKIQQELNLLKQKEGFWQEKVNALQSSLSAKQALLDQLSAQMGQMALPPELSGALAEWARQSGSDLVDYDEKTGIVRFKSDLLFSKGDDTVEVGTIPQLEALAKILSSPAAEGFDILIVGHTDDIPILKPDTKLKHPTNWYLSAHRSIAVEKVLAGAGMNEIRMAVMGMGEFRPIEPNLPDNKGNPRNRRVEIYIVPAGQIRIATEPAGGE